MSAPHEQGNPAEWWKLYREERARFCKPSGMPKRSEIVRAAREATRRLRERRS